ncbi:hypothetical protein ANN_15588 [Periplaneta americana]|uniref:Uncharacterized protein n=1 Tax=Periplaneta americana TaxID=6978 RepID=A0ABQ8SGS0_PERAM|nr:hypothetical protein ANN_15588 [Periplaneta americana]
MEKDTDYDKGLFFTSIGRLEQVGPAPCPRERVLSPSPRREFKRKKSPVPSLRTPESSHDSTQQHSSLESTESTTRGPGPTVPDLLMLARTDSGGKTGTDLSETSTCTTEDYATANDYNSGTDTSSRRSLIHAVGGLAAQGSGSTGGSFGAGEGSSFESASSHYSLARELHMFNLKTFEMTFFILETSGILLQRIIFKVNMFFFFLPVLEPDNV